MIQNPILKAALEELQAAGVSDQPVVSSEDEIKQTDVESVDAIAALQDKVDTLEDENNATTADAIVANGAQVQDDLEEIAKSAVALENLGNLALAAGNSGTATQMFNAGIALGMESICNGLQWPSITAALESEQPQLAGPGAENEAAKSLGERAKAAAKNMGKVIMAFLKRIKDWFVSFVGKATQAFASQAAIAKELATKLAPMKDGVEIENEAFIASLGLITNDASADFKAYGMFSAKTYGMLTNKQLLDGVVSIAKSKDVEELDAKIHSFHDSIARSLFTTATGVEDEQVYQAVASPRLIGGLQYTMTTRKSVTNGSNCAIAVDRAVETVKPKTIRGPKTSDAREMLELIQHWAQETPKLKDALNALDKATAVGDGNDAATQTSRAFMTVVTQLVTVFAPSVINHNSKVGRKYISYVKQALAASEEGKAPEASASREAATV